MNASRPQESPPPTAVVAPAAVVSPAPAVPPLPRTIVVAARGRPRVLLVLAPSPLASAVAGAMAEASLDVRHAPDAFTACTALVRERFDAAVVDLSLADVPAGEVLRRAREADGRMSLVGLGGEGGGEFARPQALVLGADDFVARDAGPVVLAARVRARLDGQAAGGGAPVRAGRVDLDVGSGRAWVGGEPVVLTPREFAILRVLVDARGQPVTRGALLACLDEASRGAGSNALDVHLHRLRRKVGREHFRTLRGAYVFSA